MAGGSGIGGLDMEVDFWADVASRLKSEDGTTKDKLLARERLRLL